MPESSAAERLPDTPERGNNAAVTVLRRRVIGRPTGLLVRVDRITITLAGLGVCVLLAAAVLVTLLVAHRGAAAGPATDTHGPTVTLDGPGVATYIAQNFAKSGVTCPTVSTALNGSFLCSDPSGDSFTVTIIDHGRAYSVHPN